MAAQRPEELHREWSDRFNANDLDGLLQLYEDDATFLPEPGGDTVRGKNAIREVLNGIRPQSLRSYPGRIEIESVVLRSFAVDVDAESQLSREVDVLWVKPKAIMLDGAPTARAADAARRATDVGH